MPEHSAIDFAKISEQTQKVLSTFMDKHKDTASNLSPVVKAFGELTHHMLQDPERLVRLQLELYQNYLGLWAGMAERMMGQTPAPSAEPEKGDRRFAGTDWQENPVFDYVKQSYLLTSKWLLTAVRGTEGMDEKTKAKVDFYTRQFLDAISPSNFLATNPDAIKRTLETKGENLVKGLQNILKDIERGSGNLHISMTDYSAFEVGKNLAITPGQVVFRNKLFELIQYKPTTAKVHERPLLIIPPWINKFYILDLKPENSFIKYAVDAGFTVFIISWKNPDSSYKNVGFEDYLTQGALTALEKTLEITDSADANVVGYCIGGTLLSALMAVMNKKKDKRIHAATFFTTLIDFREAGELGVFIDEEQVTAVEAKMEKAGVLEGREMAGTFSSLRANDLIWSFVVNNYLMGQDPFPFDILYWNDDPTRMPAAMHSYYLRNMYLENNLIKPDFLHLCGVGVDIHRIEQPLYMVSAINDHITPWQSCFSPLHNMKSKSKRFVLSKAGHVAGVVNPPGAGKRAYWAAEVETANADDWLKKAKMTEDSWWPDWAKWLASQSGKQVAAPKTLGNASLKPLCPAPGTYILEKA